MPGGVADWYSPACWWGLIPKKCSKHAQCYTCDFLPSGQSSLWGCGWLSAHVLPFPGLPAFSVRLTAFHSVFRLPQILLVECEALPLQCLGFLCQPPKSLLIILLCAPAPKQLQVKPCNIYTFLESVSVHWEIQLCLLTEEWNFLLQPGNRRRGICHFKWYLVHSAILVEYLLMNISAKH